MPSVQLATKLNKFNTKYQINFDVDAMVNEARIDDAIDEYKFDRKDRSIVNAERYYKTLTKLIDESLTTKTKISSSGVYNLEEFNFTRFINEFEEIVADKNNELEQPRERSRFEKMSFTDLLNKVKNNAKIYNQSLKDIWAHKIVDNKSPFTYRDLETVTNRAIGAIEGSLDRGADKFSRSDLANIVYAKEAMEKVRQSRTGWWKVFNLLENYREYKYLRDLTAKVTEYTEKRYPVGTILEKMPTGLLKNAYENPITTSEADKVEQVKEFFKEENQKRSEISNVAEEMEKVVENPKTKENLIEDILKALPKGGFPDALKRNFLNSNNMTASLIDNIQSYNQTFDNYVGNGSTPEAVMPEMVGQVFEKAFSMAGTLGYIADKEKLVAAQAITDAMLKKISPVALDSEKLGKFAEGYVLNNASQFTEITGFDASDLPVEEARADYDMLTRELINVNEANLNSAAKIVEPVQPNTQIKPPMIAGNN